MRVVYRDAKWKIKLDTTSDDIAGLIAILKVAEKVNIKAMEYKIEDYLLKYDTDDTPELYIQVSEK